MNLVLPHSGWLLAVVLLDRKSKMLRSNGLLRTVALNTNPYDGSEFKKGNQGLLDEKHV